MSKQTTKEKMLTLCVHSGLPRYKHHLLPKPLASPPSYFMNIRELMLAGRESRKGLGQREVSEGSKRGEREGEES